MFVAKTINAYQEYYENTFKSGQIGFVPTMGFLHDGHISLVRESVKNNDFTVVSIFVNPKQFGQNEDLAAYPKDFNRDRERLETEGVDLLFFPDEVEIYPEKNQLSIHILPEFTNILCGRFRDSHFEGVALVVLKLFNIIRPDNAYFGQKDYQQFQLIQTMIDEFNLAIKLHAMPIIREKSGLAMSSRNSYLSPSDKLLAANIYKGLLHIEEQVMANNLSLKDVSLEYTNYLKLKSDKMKMQYIEVYDRRLKPLSQLETGNMFMGTAVFIGNVRLIDNILF
ncbi:MAG: pantoate--beta-alanine ligase [Candidatus Margulisbacteria bacterium GWF2_35_9]|nr:MAG: pantoate--beta-alanine ligase [Candidatus Margulisbacteria bacterium GWF2_35_9]